MNFIKKIFGGKNKIDENEIDENEPNDLVSIKYSVTAEGDVEINLEWEDGGSLGSEWLGELIAAIHSGSLDGAIVSILTSHADEKPEDAIFVSEVIAVWADVLLKIDSANISQLLRETDGAVVLPSEVFGLNKPVD